MLRRVRWAHHDLAGHFAVQVEQKVFLEAVEGFGTALATVTHRLVLNGNASIGRYMLFDPPPAWPTLGVWLGVLRHKLADRLHHLLQRWLVRRKALLRQPAFPPFHLLQHQAQCTLPCRRRSPI